MLRKLFLLAALVSSGALFSKAYYRILDTDLANRYPADSNGCGSTYVSQGEDSTYYNYYR